MSQFVQDMIESLLAQNTAGMGGIQFRPQQSPVMPQGQGGQQTSMGMNVRQPPQQPAVPPPQVQGLPPQQAVALQQAQAQRQQLQQQAQSGGFMSAANAKHQLRQGADAYQQQMIDAAETLRKQEEEAKKALGDDVYKMAMEVSAGNDEMSRAMASRAMADPQFGKQVQEQLLGQMTIDKETGIKQVKEAKTEDERYEAYRAFNIPDPQAKAMAKNEDTSMQDGIKAYFDQVNSNDELQQMRWNTQIAQGAAMDKIDNAMRQTWRTIGKVGPWSAGLASISKVIPGTPAHDLMVMLDTQRADIAFRELKAMREASKTGGALGNVSNREIELLYSSFAGLKEGMSGDELKKSLNDIMMKYQKVMWGLENESKYQQMVESGQMSVEAATKQMREDRNTAVNMSMAEKYEVNPEAVQHLMQNPDLVDDFEKKYGWRPSV